MSQHHADTIAAVATPPGRGGIGIVRLSGLAVPQIALAILGAQPQPRIATLCKFINADGSTIDTGVALFFPGPASYTGEDVLELQAHGSPVVLERLVARAVELGARQARAGEFTERAFLNDKMDLTQAEAVADLIDSASLEAARCAIRALSGEFATRIHQTVEQLIGLRTHIEAHLDFPDEDIAPDQLKALFDQTEALQRSTTAILADATQGARLRDGLQVVIAGPPNAGKSSLLNRLARNERAIVTDVAGTTRDVLHEAILIDGIPVHLTDTAGIRETTDTIEREGVRRAREVIGQADIVLWVVDDTRTTDADIVDPATAEAGACIVVNNKIDRSGSEPHIKKDATGNAVFVSAKTGAGIDLLTGLLTEGTDATDTGTTILARRRHIDALIKASSCMQVTGDQLQAGALELAAEELRVAQHELAAITGEFSSEDLLGKIFSDFCIGK